MTLAQRFTTEYKDFEDRIRVSHQIDSGEVVVTWLTRRLTDRLVAHLTAWLQKETEQVSLPDVLQSFAQEAAATELQQAVAMNPQAAVKPPPASTEWLIHEIDINTQGAGAGLKFRGETADQAIQLSLSRLQLRQWLNILRSQYVLAHWPLTAWPDWLQPDPLASETSKPGSAPLH